MNYIFTQDHFQLCKNITWEDVILKIDMDTSLLRNFQNRIIMKKISNHFEAMIAPTMILHSDFYPNSINLAYEEVKKEKDITVLHVYTSFGKSAITMGRHNDDDDVLIVQSIGKMKYLFDDNSSVVMNPGDSLYIPKGMYHNPIVIEPRVTLSFSWE